MYNERSINVKSNPLVEMMIKHLEETQTRNPAFSLRAFAKKIGVSHSTLSSLLNFKRPISPTQTERIALGLGLSPMEIDALKKFYFVEHDHFESENETKIFMIKNPEFFSKWFVRAIFELSKTENYKSDKNWIAFTLGISNKDVDEAIEVLCSENLAEKENDTFKIKPDLYEFKLKASKNFSKEFNKTIAKKVLTAIETDSMREDETFNQVLAVSETDLQYIKKMILRLQNKVSKFTTDNHSIKQKVYFISVNLNELTKNQLH